MNTRQQHILELIIRHSQVSVDQLVTQTSASPATIRRDLQRLEQAGRIERFHGGAKLSLKNRYEQSFERRAHINIEQKMCIAEIAANLIDDGDSILLGAGSTTLYVARALAGQKKNLTVITNNLFIVQEAANFSSFTLNFLGGNLDYANMESNGPSALENIQKHVVDKAIIGVNGLTAEHGGTSIYEQNAFLYRAMTEVARQVIVVADSSKFDARATHIAVPVSRIHHLVTDKGASQKHINRLRAQGIEVHTV